MLAVGLLLPGEAAAQASNVVFVNIDGEYSTVAALIPPAISSAGGTVTELPISDTQSTYLSPGDLDQADQVWVVDWSAGADNSGGDLASYHVIADWYAAQSAPDLILDAQMLASLQANVEGGILYNSVGIPNTQRVANYYQNLAKRAGGLVLITGQAPGYTQGINTINSLINIAPFTGSFYSSPYVAVGDAGNPLLSQPSPATQDLLADGGNYLYADFPVGWVPYNPQTNGQVLHPVAWVSYPVQAVYINAHPVISSTIPGLVGPSVKIDSPSTSPEYVAYSHGPLTLGATVTNGTGGIAWLWWVDPNVTHIATTATTTLATVADGPTRYTVRVTDSDYLMDQASITIYSGFCTDATACPANDFCVDGVCCDTSCGGGVTSDCQACSVAAGAATDGTCGPTDGNACDDGNLCTTSDQCHTGTCSGTPVTCSASDECHQAGTCDPATGQCSNPTVPDGTSCTGGTCQAGTCEPAASNGDAGPAGGDSGQPASGGDPGVGGDSAIGSPARGCNCSSSGRPLAPLMLGWVILWVRRSRHRRQAQRGAQS